MGAADRSGLGFDAQTLERVVFVGGDGGAGVQTQLADAAGIVDTVVIGVRAPKVLNDISRRVMAEDAQGSRPARDIRQPVGIGGEEVIVDDAIGRFGGPVAVRIICPKLRAIITRRRCRPGKAALIGVGEGLVVGRNEAVRQAGDVGKVGAVDEAVEDFCEMQFLRVAEFEG
jgi:hypothetical protein